MEYTFEINKTHPIAPIPIVYRPFYRDEEHKIGNLYIDYSNNKNILEIRTGAEPHAEEIQRIINETKGYPFPRYPVITRKIKKEVEIYKINSPHDDDYSALQ